MINDIAGITGGFNSAFITRIYEEAGNVLLKLAKDGNPVVGDRDKKDIVYKTAMKVANRADLGALRLSEESALAKVGRSKKGTMVFSEMGKKPDE